MSSTRRNVTTHCSNNGNPPLSPSSYYFASHRYRRTTDFQSSAARDTSSGSSSSNSSCHGSNTSDEMEKIPNGLYTGEFYSRPVNPAMPKVKEEHRDPKVAPPSEHNLRMTSPLLLERKVPVKIEPKGYFAVERTFLLWMHSSLWLFGASLTILSFPWENDPVRIWYGAMILPVALAFSTYAIYQYIRRVRMLKRKAPGPYEDLVGPTILSLFLMCSICGQFCLKLLYYRESDFESDD